MIPTFQMRTLKHKEVKGLVGTGVGWNWGSHPADAKAMPLTVH